MDTLSIMQVLLYNPEFIFEVDNPTEEMYVKALKSNPKLIKFISPLRQTEKMQLIAVKANGELIYYIQNPSYNVKKAAIIQNPYCIKYLENLEADLIQKAIEYAPLCTKYLPQFKRSLSEVKPEEIIKDIKCKCCDKYLLEVDDIYQSTVEVTCRHCLLTYDIEK